RFLWNNQRAFFHIGDKAHLSELTGTQNVSRIWKGHFITNRAGLWIEIAIQRVKRSLLRIDIAVAENQIEFERVDVALPLVRIGMARNEIGKWPFARSNDSFDRVELSTGRERSSTRASNISQLGSAPSS